MQARKHIIAVSAALVATSAPAQDGVPLEDDGDAAITAPVPTGLSAAMPRVPNQSIDGSDATSVQLVSLSAVLQQGDAPILSGLQWHVFELATDTRPGDLVAVRRGGSQELTLKPGSYVVHVSYGRASAVSPLEVTAAGSPVEPLVLDAGAMKLSAEAGGQAIGDLSEVRFSIYEADPERRRLILPDVKVGETVLLAGGVYRVVVRYGPHNAAAGADIRVHPGEITEATLGVPGAEITLNLVRENSDTPLAAVEWQVFDGSGRPLFEADIPSPSLVLGEGSYTVEARHNDRTIGREFEVRAGRDETVRLTLDR